MSIEVLRRIRAKYLSEHFVELFLVSFLLSTKLHVASEELACFLLNSLFSLLFRIVSLSGVLNEDIHRVIKHKSIGSIRISLCLCGR